MIRSFIGHDMVRHEVYTEHEVTVKAMCGITRMLDSIHTSEMHVTCFRCIAGRGAKLRRLAQLT